MKRSWRRSLPPKARRLAALAAALALAAAGCGKRERPAPPDAIERARAALEPVRQKLERALMDALPEGPDYAIAACRDTAPRIMAEASGDGLTVGRSSHLLRNPDNAPFPAEADSLLRRQLITLMGRYRQREDFREPQSVTLEDGTFLYVEPIFMKPLCLACHGPHVNSHVRAAVQRHYPDDRAVGFEEGAYRGVFWVRIDPR